MSADGDRRKRTGFFCLARKRRGGFAGFSFSLVTDLKLLKTGRLRVANVQMGDF